jgi:MFS family permease
MGLVYFFGFGISALIIPRIADDKGRKWPYFWALIVQLFGYYMVVRSKSIYETIFYYVVIGLCAGGRNVIGIMYLNEFVEEKYENAITCTANVGDSLVMIFQGIYYSYNRDWLPLHEFGLLISAVVMIGILLLPESPKFYYANRKFNKARECMK